MIMQTKDTDEIGILVLAQEEFNLEMFDHDFEKFGVTRTIWYDSMHPHLKYSQMYIYERGLHASKY